MKIKELISILQEYDENIEVMTKDRYTEDMKPVTSAEKKYLSLDKVIVYIG